jgi:hypothetical protein
LALPVLTVYSTILSTAWVSAGTNIWKANITTSTNVSGFTPSLANCGFIKTVDSIYGERKFNLSGLVKQWQFYCNFGSGTTGFIYVYSTSKPSLVSATIQVSNDEKIINLSDYEYIHDVKISGTAQAGLLTDQPVRLHISYVHVEEVGGKFKSLTDSLREGAGISFYNGATNDTVDHCYVSYAFECAYTNQTHASGAVPILYKNLYYWRDTSFKCESSYNPSIAVSGAHGFSGCLIDTCYFSYDGYSWSHPPVKPTDNQAIGQLNNFWQGIPRRMI